MRQLPEHGWRVAAAEEGLEWWADEMWLLESVWSPVGVRAYVTFMVNPMSGVDRKKGQGVWAVMASPDRPGGRLNVEGEFTLSLGQGWKRRLPEFFEHLSELRGRGSGLRA